MGRDCSLCRRQNRVHNEINRWEQGSPMECNRKESLTFWTSSKTGKFTIGDMRLGWRLEKTGVIFFFFLVCSVSSTSKANEDLWNDKDI